MQGDANYRKSSGFVMKVGTTVNESASTLQFIYDITMNAIRAIGKVGGVGDVYWDIDPETGGRKLTCIDNGAGFTPGELDRMTPADIFGERLAATLAEMNSLGVVFKTWSNGVGSMVRMKVSSRGELEIVQVAGRNSVPLGADDRPVLSRITQPISHRGNMVTLLGHDETDFTIRPPEKAAHNKSRWIVRYLNNRFFDVPKGVTIRALDFGNATKRLMRIIEGQHTHLDEHSSSKGTVDTDVARFHWWVIDENTDSGVIANRGRVAATLGGEVYNMLSEATDNSRMQRTFGVEAGQEKIVIIVEPRPDLVKVASDGYTLQMRDGRDLSWQTWGRLFRDRRPKQLVECVMAAAAQLENTDNLADIQKRLAPVFELVEGDGERELPRVVWVSASENGLDALADRAAMYDSEANEIVCNSDFPWYQGMVKALSGEYPNEAKVVRETRKWFESGLVEAVLAIRGLATLSSWTEEAVSAALSPEALTTAVAHRYHMLGAIRRGIGSSEGRRKTGS